MRNYGLDIDRERSERKPGCPVGKYRGSNNFKWRGGREAYNARRKLRRQRLQQCIDCQLSYRGKEGNNSKYCEGCRTVLAICSYCHKSWNLKRGDFNDGRGLYCSLNCYRLHLTLFPPLGADHHSWKGGLTKLHGYGNRFKGAYKTRRDNADGSFTKLEWRNLKRQYNHRCLSCRQQEPDIHLEPDHIQPLSRGGTNYITNIQPLCRSCNARKYDKLINYIPLYA